MSETGDQPKTPEAANDAETPEPQTGPANDADSFQSVDDIEGSSENAGPDAAAAAAALADRVNELEAELAKEQDERLRALAEADNARRRAQKDREEANRYGSSALARDVISVADNLSRALEAMPETSDNAAMTQLAEGVAMVERELAQALDRNNIKTVGAVGDPFDPNTCQAVFEVETTDVPPGAVAQVMQKGYKLHDRLIRAAMVGVAKAPAGDTGPSDGGDDQRGGQVDETA